MSHPINPGPSTNSASGDLPAYLSNGLIGLRVRDLPLRAGIAIVSGLSGEHPVARIEAAAMAAAYPLAGDVRIGRVWLSNATQHARFESQEYAFSRGELRAPQARTSTCDIAYVTECLGTEDVQRTRAEWGTAAPSCDTLRISGALRPPVSVTPDRQSRAQPAVARPGPLRDTARSAPSWK